LGERASALRVAAEEAERAGAGAYLVGGPVRDLLLGHPIRDLDVLLSDGLDAVARATASRLGGGARLRREFLTATITTSDCRIDLVRARREHYPRPGALPVVEPGTLIEDLMRRDFAAHALALPLGEHTGQVLLDPCGGAADLERRELRVLHDASFRDDPTRLLRAARYCARLGFRLERRSARLAREALAARALDTLSGDRARHEIEYLLAEERPDRGAARAQRMGLFAGLCRRWSLANTRPLARLARIHEAPPWSEAGRADLQIECGLRLLLLEATPVVRRAALDRLGVHGRPAYGVLEDLAVLARLRRALARPLSPGRLDERLAGLGDTALLLAYCAGPGAVSRQVKRYVNVLRAAPSPLDGHRARALGASGPAVGSLLRAARTRALDGGRVDDAWLARWLARHG
jgi:tRNA nucleotidyltransferase (CCA-adding enzyme)